MPFWELLVIKAIAAATSTSSGPTKSVFYQVLQSTRQELELDFLI